MKIVCIGSSSVEGIGDSLGIGWAGRLNNYLQAKGQVNKYRVFNLGFTGDDVAATVKKYHTEALNRRPHLVIIFTGSNDCVTHTKDKKVTRKPNPEQYIQYWSEFLLELTTAGHKTIVLGPTMANESKGPLDYKGEQIVFKNSDLSKYNKTLKALCSEHNVEFIELFNLFKEDINKYSFDFIHPNNTGYDKIFETIKSYLEGNSYV